MLFNHLITRPLERAQHLPPFAPPPSPIFVPFISSWSSLHEPPTSVPEGDPHGALHREHMMVPLLVNRPTPRRPRRTVDVMPSALKALGIAIPAGLDGTAFN